MRTCLPPMIVIALGISIQAQEPAPSTDSRIDSSMGNRRRDDFEEKLALKWSILREDKSHWSLDKHDKRLGVHVQE